VCSYFIAQCAAYNSTFCMYLYFIPPMRCIKRCIPSMWDWYLCFLLAMWRCTCHKYWCIVYILFLYDSPQICYTCAKCMDLLITMQMSFILSGILIYMKLFFCKKKKLHMCAAICCLLWGILRRKFFLQMLKIAPHTHHKVLVVVADNR